MSPCWETVLSDIRTHFSTFNRSVKTLQRWYNKYRNQVKPEAQALSIGRKCTPGLKEKIREHILHHSGKARSYRTTASAFHIPLSTARVYIKRHIGFIRKIKPNIPYSLSDYQKKLRVYYCTVMMAILEVCREVEYKNIITGDESYFVYDYEPNWIYLPPETPPPPRVKSQIHSNKLMLTIFLWGGGLCLLSDIPQNTTMTSSVYIDSILTPIREWWRKKQEITSDEWEKLKENTERAVQAAARAAESLVGKDLSGWIPPKNTPYHKLDFIKQFETHAVGRIPASKPQNPPPPAPLTSSLPEVPKQIPVTPPSQTTSNEPSLASHNFQSTTHFLKPNIIASALTPAMAPPLASTSISKFLPQTTPSFPIYNIHRSLQYPPNFTNAASLLLLLFGNEGFRTALSEFQPDEETPPFVREVQDLYKQLSLSQVSPVDIRIDKNIQTVLINDDSRAALNNNIELLRSYFWGNSKLVDINTITVTLRTTLNSNSRRYLEEALETVPLPLHPPSAFLISIDRQLPSGDRLNTTFYFPVFDELTLPQYRNTQYQLRGLITCTTQTIFTAIVEDSIDRRWIQYSNAQNITLIDSSWPRRLAYGDDYDDKCSSACVLLYERQDTLVRPSTYHDTYTPLKQRRLSDSQKRSRSHYANPMSTPDHARKYVRFEVGSDSDSLSSDPFSSTSTSSTLFDEDDSDSVSMERCSSPNEEEIPSYSSVSSVVTGGGSPELLPSSPWPTLTSTLPPSFTSTLPPSFTSTPPLTNTTTPPPSFTSTPPPSFTSTLPPSFTSTLPPSFTSTPPLTITSTPPLTNTTTPPLTITSTLPPSFTSTPSPSFTSTPPLTITSTPPLTITSTLPPSFTSPPAPSFTSTPPPTYIPPSSLPSTPAYPLTHSAPFQIPSPPVVHLQDANNRSVFVDNNGAMHIPAASSLYKEPLELFLHVDNARVHTSLKATEFLEGLPFIKFPHPPYSPDIAPCDFFLFGYLKRKLAMDGVHASDITNVVRKYLVEIDSEVYLHVFDHWHDRLKWVASHGGEYYPANNRKQLVEEYKHFYHLRSNSALKAAEDKPFLCQLCNRRYSSKPSLQTHQSLKHSFRQFSTKTESGRETILKKEANHHVDEQPFRTHRPSGCQLVEHFSCVPVSTNSHAKGNLHQLSLRIWNPDSKETLTVSGMLILQQFVKSNVSFPVCTKRLVPDSRKDQHHCCNLCIQKFSTDVELLIHCAKSHPEQLRKQNNLLGCTLCSAMFSSPKGLLTHIGMQHRNRHDDPSALEQSSQMSCETQLIPIQVSEKPVLAQYADSAAESWLCPYCNRNFATRLGTKMHISKIHKEQGQTSVELLNSFLKAIMLEGQNIRQIEGDISDRWRRLQRLTDDNSCDILLLQNKIEYVLCRLFYCAE